MVDTDGILDLERSTDTHFVIRDGVTEIKNDAFYDYSEDEEVAVPILAAIDIPSSVIAIEGNAFLER